MTQPHAAALPQPSQGPQCYVNSLICYHGIILVSYHWEISYFHNSWYTPYNTHVEILNTQLSFDQSNSITLQSYCETPIIPRMPSESVNNFQKWWISFSTEFHRNLTKLPIIWNVSKISSKNCLFSLLVVKVVTNNKQHCAYVETFLSHVNYSFSLTPSKTFLKKKYDTAPKILNSILL